jgi:hypothetical protein
MNRSSYVFSLALGLWAAACGPEALDPTASSDDGGTRGGASGDERGAEGASAEGAGERDGGGRDGGADGTDGKDDSGKDDGGKDDGGVDGGDPDDPNSGAAIRNCFGCWEDYSAQCQVELDACKASLACSQLMDCPLACGYQPECITECNEIIPSGVEPLTAVIECMVCSGGPCAADCMNDVMLSYCG